MMQHTDHVAQKCILETYIIFLTNVIPKHLIKKYVKKRKQYVYKKKIIRFVGKKALKYKKLKLILLYEQNYVPLKFLTLITPVTSE